MANPWFRLYSEFAHDPKIQMLPEAMQRRYVMLMCLRCSETLETLHETEIAFQLRLSEAELIETKNLFISKNFIDKQWNLLNWDKRQFVSDSSTMRVRKYRDKKKQPSNADETLQKQLSNAIDTDTDKKQIHKKATVVARPVEVTEQTWNDWLALRKSKKAAVTETVLWGAIEEANKLGWNLEKFLIEWCTRGSQGLKAEWINPVKPNPADIVRLTVPSKNEPDPALEKIKADEKKATPMPDHIRKYIAEVVRKA